MLDTAQNVPPTLAEVRWMAPKKWPSRSIVYKRTPGRFITVDEQAERWLRDRLELAAEASRRVAAAWSGKESTSANFSAIRADADAYLTAQGMPDKYWPTVWAAVERTGNRCQEAVRKGKDISSVLRSLQGQHPRAFSTRLLVGAVENVPLLNDGNRWRIEPDIWATAAQPLTDDLNVAYGEVALIGNRWATRFVTTQWDNKA